MMTNQDRLFLNKEFKALEGKKILNVEHKREKENSYLLRVLVNRMDFLFYYTPKKNMPSLEGCIDSFKKMEGKELVEALCTEDGALVFKYKAGEGTTTLMSYIDIVDVTIFEVLE